MQSLQRMVKGCSYFKEKNMKKYKVIAICIEIVNLIGMLLVGLTLTNKGFFFDKQFIVGAILIIGSYIVGVTFVIILIGKYGK